MTDTFIPDPQPAGTQFIPDTPGASPAQAAGFIPDLPQGRGIWQAIKDYPEHFVKGILETPQRAIENSATSLGTGTYDPEPTVAAAMLGGVKPSIAGVRTPLKLSPKEGEIPKPAAEPQFIPDMVPESVASAAIKFNDKIYIGNNHLEAMEKAATEHGTDADNLHTKADDSKTHQLDAWMTSSGRLIDSKEAAKIAKSPHEKLDSSDPEAPKAAEPPPAPEPSPTEMNAAQKAARVVKNILSPDTVSPVAESAAADIRSAGGKAARDTEVTRASLEPYMARIGKLPDADRLDLTDYIEGRSKDVPLADKTLQPLADTFRDAMKEREAKLKELKSVTKEDFVEDYFPHMWKDPAKGEAFVREYFGGAAKQGSGASLKKRTVPTIREGIEAGLEPVTTDPLEVGMRYVTSMDHFVAAQQVLEKAKADGNVRYIKPKIMGASGNPEVVSGPPPGWVPIKGRGSANAQGWQAYAPEDFARVYNNYIDKGLFGNPDVAPIYNAVRNTSNAVTSLELGLSGFHAATMVQEAFVSGLSKAVAELASGRPIKALRSVVETTTKPITNALTGKEFKDVYLKKIEGSPDMKVIVDLITEAGGRGAGNKHALDYRYSQMGSYWDTFKKGSFKAEVKAAAAEARQAYGLGSIKVLAKQFGRVMQTVAKPLFEHYIPAMKNGAAFDMMHTWMESNPTASRAGQLAAARKIVNSIDNRFGEMIQDNIFWNKTLKQSLQVAMRSYSWFLGTAKEIGGGAAQLARNPARLSMKHPDWKPGANYVLALPIVYATFNAAYQYLKTGKSPESIDDVMRGGQTGGMVEGSGTRRKIPERVMQPGYMKDVFGWYHDPVTEAKNKIATAPMMAINIARNKDWKDQPIRDVRAPALEQIQQLFKYIYDTLGPISVKQLKKGEKPGSNISKGEAALGFRPSPRYLGDPDNTKKTDDYFFGKEWDKKQNYDKKQEKLYKGPQ